MFDRRGTLVITASAVGLAFFLGTPQSAPSQDVAQPNPSTPALYAPLRPVSGFSSDGVGIRSNGGRVLRPIRRADWQAYFRCRMAYGFGGYGLPGYGWTPFPPNWLPYPPSTWDFGVFGSIGYRRGRFYHAWGPWHMGSRGYIGFGSYGVYGSCLDPFGWSPFLMVGRSRGFVRVRQPSPYSVMYDLGDRIPLGIADGWPPGAVRSGAGPRWPGDRAPRAPTGREETGPEDETSTRAFIDPVRRESLDRNRWIGPREGSGAVPVSRKTPGRIVEPVRSPSSRRGTLRPETFRSRPNRTAGVTPTRKPAVPRTAPRPLRQPSRVVPAKRTGGKTKPER